MNPTFYTDFRYSDRETKAKYVWLKYQPILQGCKILDVGADEQYLKQQLDSQASYWGIGLGGHPDQQVNLEREKIPFSDRSFDCVLCLDVLEHVDNIHEVFDELCRVTKRHVIISLPNAWASFYQMLRVRDYYPGQPLKFYGLPSEPPEDRHKWFFSIEEAERFITYRANKNHMTVVQMDSEYDLRQTASSLKDMLRKLSRRLSIIRDDINPKNLYASTLWAVLEKKSDG